MTVEWVDVLWRALNASFIFAAFVVGWVAGRANYRDALETMRLVNRLRELKIVVDYFNRELTMDEALRELVRLERLAASKAGSED